MKRITDLFRSVWSLRPVVSARDAASGPARRGARSRAFLALEALEDRTVPSTLTVTTPTDVIVDGDGLLSLREAMLIANDNTGATVYDGVSSSDVADSIVFDNSLTDESILLNGTQLPFITSDLTITGLGADHLTIDAQNNSGIFVIDPGVTAHISDLTLTRGNYDTGGAIVNLGTLTVTGSTLAGNSGVEGGAIYNFSDASLTVEDSILSDNSASAVGGAIFIFGGTLIVTGSTLSGNSAGYTGGAIENRGMLTVTGSTLSGNSARYNGGGIYNGGTMTVAGSTLSGNSADDDGGAILNEGTLTVAGSTIVLNRADADGNPLGTGGGIYIHSGSGTLDNTIVAGNLRGTGTTADDIGGFSNLGSLSSHNLIGNAGTAGGLVDGVNGSTVGKHGVGVIDINTVLDTTLADNGGPTLTHALVTGSPAIDAGDNSLIPADLLDLDGDGDTTEAVPFDQRGAGFPRILGGTVDIGAFELLQNQAPVVCDFTLVGAEDNVLSFTAADFTGHYSDADGDPLAAVRIESLPAGGTLKLNGVAVSASQVIAAGDLGNLVFVPSLHFHGLAAFTITATDSISGFALTAATVTLHIQSAAEQAAAIAAEIDALYDAGVINEGQAEALTFHLKDNKGDAGKVGAYRNQVNAFVLGGILTEEQASGLRKLGSMLLISLTTG